MTREELWLAAIAGLEGAVPPDYPAKHHVFLEKSGTGTPTALEDS